MVPSIAIKKLKIKLNKILIMAATTKITPYIHYQNTEEWAIIAHLLEELISNQDIELKTSPEYVIGYLVEKLRNKDLREEIKNFVSQQPQNKTANL
jgi:hypothetical protein